VPCIAQPRGARALTGPGAVTYDLLWHRVEIEVEDPEARRFLDVLDHGATQEDIEPEVDVHLRVDGGPGAYRLHENDDAWRTLATATDVANIVHTRVHGRALELAARKGWVCLHGFTAVIGGRRFVIVGPSGAGKTTTALGLLAAGVRVDGDECVLVSGGTVVAVPRRFLAKAGTAELVPGAARLLDAALVLGEREPPVAIVDPRASGVPWRTSIEPIDDLVLLERGDGPTEVEVVDGGPALAVLLPQVLRGVESPSLVARELAAVIARARCWRLRVGPAADGPERLESLASVNAPR
jgi:hypothetical protein